MIARSRPQPTALRLLAVAAACAALSAGCREATPEEAFRGLAQAAERGDTDAFLAHLTDRSRALVEGALAAAPDAGALLAPSQLSGRVTIVAAATDGDRAELTVAAASGPDAGAPVPVVLAREGGRWRVDLVETQRIWSRLRLHDPASPLLEVPGPTAP